MILTQLVSTDFTVPTTNQYLYFHCKNSHETSEHSLGVIARHARIVVHQRDVDALVADLLAVEL
jgi:hypothetical protein